MLTVLSALVGCNILIGIPSVFAQKACNVTPEAHPSLVWSNCAWDGVCTPVNGELTIDANWRWTHAVDSYDSCFVGVGWDRQLCPDPRNCTANCCIDGADYAGAFGVHTSGADLTMDFVTNHQYGRNVGSRLYMLEDANTYQLFFLLGNEFTFDVDVSQLGCGLNGALYFVSMDKDGGMYRYPSNEAGPKYGTGYCDSACLRTTRWINGVANSAGFSPINSTADWGSCCSELGLWEANVVATAFVAHPCCVDGQHVCVRDACEKGNTNCDADGCDFNIWRQGNRTFYGPGPQFIIDSTKRITVVTQFIADENGHLVDIIRLYMQNGRLIRNPQSLAPGVRGSSINSKYCRNQKRVFQDPDYFQREGGMRQMGEAMSKGMVLTFSLWTDSSRNMLWLDSYYPINSTNLGASRGSCPITSGTPAELEAVSPNSTVLFSNIRYGPIGSTLGFRHWDG